MNEKMTTEEYLDKMETLENRKQETEKNEKQKKKSLPFTKLGVYTYFKNVM